MSVTSSNNQLVALEEFEKEAHEGIKKWISEKFDGEVTDIARLERWRPQWKVSFVTGGEDKAVLVRGNRPISPVSMLRMEMEVMAVLEKHGVKVPPIYGWMEQPVAFVMGWIDVDEDRAPAMLHTSMANPTESMSDERWQAFLNYMGEMAKMHDVPISEFDHVETLPKNLTDPVQIRIHQSEAYYALADRLGGYIDPQIEYLQYWLRNNVSQESIEPRFITGDAGQFMSEGSEIKGVLDFEIANIGDHNWDLACFRGRHPYEDMGDIPALYEEYAKVSGRPTDREAIAFQTVNFLQFSGTAAKFFTNPTSQGGNWIEGALEYATCIRRAYESIADLRGIELRYDFELPEAVDHEWESSGLEKMMVDINALPTSTAFEPWERDTLHSIPKFLLNYSRYREWYEAACIADIEQLTGGSYKFLREADEAAKDMIKAGEAVDETAVVKVMHARMVRYSMICAGTNYDENNHLFYILDRLFDK